jgi:predicted lipoprotein with Yx(FWY)xxD motif
MLRNKVASIAGPLLAAALLAAACTGNGASPAPVAPTPVPATAVPPTAVPANPATPAANADTISLSSEGYFVGPDGMTLYTFDKDAADTTNCYDACATTWPVLSVASADQVTLGDGVDASKVATITRTDGLLQVTFNHAPLYFFNGDSAVGDTNGVYTNWRLATPNTAPPAAASPESSAASSPAAYDYGNDDKYTPQPSAEGSSPAAMADTVAISDSHLVGATGFALYTFDNDTAGVSNCSGGCLDNWPALLVGAENELHPGSGLDDQDFATITRDDGTLQVTYYGLPLYYFAGDSAPSDTNGDGVGDIWHLALPQ